MPDVQPKNDVFCDALFALALEFRELDTPSDVLNALHDITSPHQNINVMGAAKLPHQWGDFEAIVKNRTLFLHDSVPDSWWPEYLDKSNAHPSPVYAMTELTFAPFTLTEMMQRLDPVGADRWSVDLSLRHGIRDLLACPVGGRWVFVYWSPDVLTSRLTPDIKALLFMAANFAVIRLHELVGRRGLDPAKDAVSLTPRELAVLQSLARGNRIADIAHELQIGEETVRTHVKKAQSKLIAKTQTHAVATAIRQGLLPQNVSAAAKEREAVR